MSKLLKSFLEEIREGYLKEEQIRHHPNMKKFKWEPSPKIGWWKDRKSLILYHGTNYKNADSIFSNGISAPTSGHTANWVSLALEPNTAYGYASMSGGETTFRNGKAIHVPGYERVIIVLKIPLTDILSNMDKSLRGNLDKSILTDKEKYEKWKKSDQEYYAASELRFPKKVPKKYIYGYMIKK
jgi:hypothetical protein